MQKELVRSSTVRLIIQIVQEGKFSIVYFLFQNISNMAATESVLTNMTSLEPTPQEIG